jgi:DNA-binding CsgD family transcriptional regulator
MISRGNVGSFGHVRALPIPTKPVGSIPPVKPRSGHVPIKHGTPEGLQRERQLGMKACDECLRAVYAKPLKSKAKPASRPVHGPAFDLTAARAAYEAGAYLQDVATAYGTTPRTLRRYLVEDGVKIRRRSRPFNPDKPSKPMGRPTSAPPFDVEWAAAEYRAGRSYGSIAAEIGHSEKTVRWHLNRAGVASRKRTEVVREKRGPAAEQIAAEHLAGASIGELSAKYGLHVKTIGHRLREVGVETRRTHARGHRAYNAIPLETEARVVELIKAGVSKRQIAREAGVAESTVALVAKRHNLRKKAA